MTDIVAKSKPKRLSKSTRTHTRRLKAAARETGAVRAQASHTPPPAKATDKTN
jgi:hypothetical protein